MKIGILFSEKDWTAAEIALKIQSLAFSNDIDCYIAPKHIQRNDDKVFIALNKCEYVIFLAHDIDVPDPLTQKELESVKSKPVLGIIKQSFKYGFRFYREFRYTLKTDAITYLQNEIKKIKHTELRKKHKAHKEEDALMLLGLTALLILLLVGLSTRRK